MFEQGSNLGFLQWKHGVLITGPPGNPGITLIFKRYIISKLQQFIVKLLKNYRYMASIILPMILVNCMFKVLNTVDVLKGHVNG